MGRPRDSLQQALRAFRTLDAGVTIPQILVFLCACEYEGASVQEVSDLSGLTQSATSRALRSLGPLGSSWSRSPAVGLVEGFLAPEDNRRHVIRLTPEGRRLRDWLDVGLR